MLNRSSLKSRIGVSKDYNLLVSKWDAKRFCEEIEASKRKKGSEMRRRGLNFGLCQTSGGLVFKNDGVRRVPGSSSYFATFSIFPR